MCVCIMEAILVAALRPVAMRDPGSNAIRVSHYVIKATREIPAVLTGMTTNHVDVSRHHQSEEERLANDSGSRIVE